MKGYKLKIQLETDDEFEKFDIEKISRDIIIPENTTMYELHIIIQKLFGLNNMKDYEFSYDDIMSEKVLTHGYIPHRRFCSTHEDMNRIYLDSFFKKKISFYYEYDYCSEWVFLVRFIKVVEYDKYYATILNYKGEYNIVENCGGPWGLEYYLKIIKNTPKKLSKHDSNMLEKFEKFDIDKTQEKLKSIFDMV